MSSSYSRSAPLLFLCLTIAACQDQIVSPDPAESVAVPRPHFAQGDNGTWTVTTLDYLGDGSCDEASCTLREAIGAASNDERIVFAAGLQGDIELPSVLPPPDDQYGFLIEDRLTIDGDGRIEIDGNGLVRVLQVDGISGDTEPVPVTLKGLTIKNGRSLAGGSAGISVVNGADLTLDHVSVVNNIASPTDGDGGGIVVSPSSALALINSTVTGNRAFRGGGLVIYGTASIIASTIAGNSAVEDGGGIYNLGELTIAGSTVSSNEAEHGGGIHLSDGSVATVSLSTISRNRVEGSGDAEGGGIFADGSLTLLSSTIVDNKAMGLKAGGAGIMVRHNISVGNSIVAGNMTDTFTNNCTRLLPNEVFSMGHNLSEGVNTGCDFTAANDVSITIGQAFTQVLEQELEDNGGPTLTHALLVRGRAVDAGYCPGETVDQRGFARPVDDPVMPNALDACDIGAYELQGPFVARTDLIVSQSADKASVKQGDLLTYTVRVQNLGPETAPNVVVTNVLSSGVTFVSATHTHTAPPAGETGTVTWYLGDLLDQGNEFTEIKVTVRLKGKTTITNTASVASDAVDPNPANNTASLSTSVTAGGTKPPGKGK